MTANTNPWNRPTTTERTDAIVADLAAKDEARGTTTTLVTKGNGTAVHIGTEQGAGYGLATLCDGWGNRGAYGPRIRPTNAPAATCKACIRAESRKAATK